MIEGLLVVQDMIEDELILRLPLVPRHPIEGCAVKSPTIDVGWSAAGQEEENPFQVLKRLKQGK